MMAETKKYKLYSKFIDASIDMLRKWRYFTDDAYFRFQFNNGSSLVAKVRMHEKTLKSGVKYVPNITISFRNQEGSVLFGAENPTIKVSSSEVTRYTGVTPTSKITLTFSLMNKKALARGWNHKRKRRLEETLTFSVQDLALVGYRKGKVA